MPVGIRSLAVHLPETARTNDYWRVRHPAMVAEHERLTLARLFSARERAAASASHFDREMAPYLADPFRGSEERRVLSPGQGSLSMEIPAAKRALEAAGLTPRDLDLVIVTSFLPDQPGVGNAAFLGRELGAECPAWNLETACSSALVSLDVACAMVESGRARRVLVVQSCSYSREADETDTLSWFMGDAAGAFVVAAEADGAGVLGLHTVHTQATCGTFYYDLVPDPAADAPRRRIQCSPSTGRVLRETSEGYVRAACEGAAERAGVGLDQIDFFVVNTPVAWFAAFCARVLGVPQSRTLSTYPRYGNIGPALMPVNLHEAATSGRIGAGSLVCIYSIGSVSTASAAVMRWGDVALGPPVPPPALRQ